MKSRYVNKAGLTLITLVGGGRFQTPHNKNNYPKSPHNYEENPIPQRCFEIRVFSTVNVLIYQSSVPRIDNLPLRKDILTK